MTYRKAMSLLINAGLSWREADAIAAIWREANPAAEELAA